MASTDDDADATESGGTEAARDGIVTAADREWSTTERGEHAFRRKQLGDAAGSERLGCSLYEVPPGKEAWPYHWHAGNEEALYVLAGEATLRMPDGETTVSAGDYAAFPAGEDGGHALRNDGEEPVRYLVVSTMRDPDVTRYPDSDKVGVFAGAPPGGDSAERDISGYFPADAAVDYWDDEVSDDGE
ncbi:MULTISPECIES: cupin domain-containing protein [Halorussus]|uniref:cupin domain-containing protein n=1 Tax=Halorussus TaxID=1070314 RepID=UPI000E216856|nr:MULTISPECIES: cupin domain-containing protein [Halorussus]NHN60384.1 cupin domain-containing protein [Halorussus sp. JP-T4]